MGNPWVVAKVEGALRGWYVLCKSPFFQRPLTAFLSRSSHARRSASGFLVPWAKKWQARQRVKRFSGRSSRSSLLLAASETERMWWQVRRPGRPHLRHLKPSRVKTNFRTFSHLL